MDTIKHDLKPYKMPTIQSDTKKSRNRINITLTAELRLLLEKLANLDGVPVARKAIDLLTKSAEEAEDILDLAVIENRKNQPTEWLTHDEVWN